MQRGLGRSFTIPLLLAAGIAFALCAVARADSLPPPIALSDSASSLALEPGAQVLVDPRGDLDIDRAVARGAEFRDPKGTDLAGSDLHPKTYWVRFRIARGTSVQSWGIIVHADVGRLDLYAPRGDGTFDRITGGFDVAGNDAAIGHRVLMFPPHAYDGTVYLRVSSAADSLDTLRIVSLQTAEANILERTTLHLFFIGYFVAIATLYLLLFVILRQRPLLQYSAIMASLVLLLTFDSGIPFGWLPPMTLAQRTLLHDVCIVTYFVLLAVFTTTFLRLVQRDRLAFVLVVVTGTINVLLLAQDFAEIGWMQALGVWPTIAYFAALLVAGFRAWRSGMRPALFYWLAIGMVLLGYGINSAVSSIPALASVPGFVIWAFEAAIALEALLLGIAVTERIRETAREYERLLVASRELEDIALHDALTGVLNRRAFDRGLADAWHTGAARGQRLGLLMIDIDHFKRFNDRYGHPAGDECLRKVAQACAGCVRGGDLFARYGGEEFAAIVPSGSMEDLAAIAWRMRAAVADLAIPHESASGIVTLSIGGAAKLASDVRSEQGLVAIADAALYRAKEEGRDRTVLDRDRTPTSKPA